VVRLQVPVVRLKAVGGPPRCGRWSAWRRSVVRL